MYHGMILECHGEKYRGKRGKGFIRLVQHQRGSQDGRSRIGSLLETFPLKKKKRNISSFFLLPSHLHFYHCTMHIPMHFEKYSQVSVHVYECFFKI